MTSQYETAESGPMGPINARTRALPGETRQRFGRSYVAYKPESEFADAMPSTWNLTYEEADSDSGPSDPYDGVQVLDVVLANPSNSTEIYKPGTLIYVGNDGLGYRSSAANPDTAKVAGALLEAAAPGTTAKYARNAVIDIFETAGIIDGGYVTLIPNQYYYLSDQNAGSWTLTPNTTDTGVTVIQCGQAVSISRMAVEIQQSTLT